MAQPGSAPGLGPGGRRFESSHSDHLGWLMVEEEYYCEQCKFYKAGHNSDRGICLKIRPNEKSPIHDRPETRWDFTCEEWSESNTSLVNRYPALKEAWDHFETLKTLVGDGGGDDV